MAEARSMPEAVQNLCFIKISIPPPFAGGTNSHERLFLTLKLSYINIELRTLQSDLRVSAINHNIIFHVHRQRKKPETLPRPSVQDFGNNHRWKESVCAKMRKKGTGARKKKNVDNLDPDVYNRAETNKCPAQTKSKHKSLKYTISEYGGNKNE